jgi:hypothetical protein
MLKQYPRDLSAHEIDAYFRTLVGYAAKDGLHEAEREYISAQAQVLAYDVSPLWAGDFNTPAYDSLTSGIKKIILRDALVLARIDGMFSQSEAQELKNLCTAMGMELNLLQDIEGWLDEYARILERGRDLFG